MFEREGTGDWQALHHPFTAPQTTDPKKLSADPGAINSRAYDLVLNGSEIGGAAGSRHKKLFLGFCELNTEVA